MMTYRTAGWVTLASGGLLVVGSFLPWVKLTAPLIGAVSKAGIEGDGVFSVAIGVLACILALVGPLQGKRRRETSTGLSCWGLAQQS